MTYARHVIKDFQTANPLYGGARVSFWTVLNGEKTNTLATLYDSISGGDELSNPQDLSSNGKFIQPVYTDVPVIMTVEGLSDVPDHDTGIVSPALILSGTGSPEGAVTATVGTLYTRLDGGASTTLYVKESGTGNTGWSAK